MLQRHSNQNKCYIIKTENYFMTLNNAFLPILSYILVFLCLKQTEQKKINKVL